MNSLAEEWELRNQQVAGSIPAGGSSLFNRLAFLTFPLWSGCAQFCAHLLHRAFGVPHV